MSQDAAAHDTERATYDIAATETKWQQVWGELDQFRADDASPRGGKYVDANTEPATVIILPVIRIDRDPDGSNGLEPHSGNNHGRRRRRRAAR